MYLGLSSSIEHVFWVLCFGPHIKLDLRYVFPYLLQEVFVVWTFEMLGITLFKGTNVNINC